jgi:hypothetical protein
MSDLSDLLKAAADTFEAQLRDAYQRGRRDERERILQLASIPHHGPVAPTAAVPQPKGRVAHGTIRPLVKQVLDGDPGLTKQEVAEAVVKLNPDVSPSSVANELQRNVIGNRRGQRQYQLRSGRWYLAEKRERLLADMDTAGTAENDHPPSKNGTGLTTSA